MGGMDKNPMCDDIPKIHHGGDTPNMGDGLGYHLVHPPFYLGECPSPCKLLTRCKNEENNYLMYRRFIH
jgi:hypothetical protein